MANEEARQKKQEEVKVNTQKWSQLVAQAWADEKLKQRLLEKPAAVLQQHGIEVPAGVEVRVVEPTDKVLYFVLPPKPADVTELTSSQLSGIAGGDTTLQKGESTDLGNVTITVLEGSATVSGSKGGGAGWACAFY
jgi:nitrile hydratase alpha subunit